MEDIISIADGTSDFSLGVDASRTPTLQSEKNPNGLPRNGLAWLINASTRGGGIIQRTGWQDIVPGVSPAALYQGKHVYEPRDANPYLIVAIAGHIIKVLLESPYTVTDLSAHFGVSLPATQPFFYFCQGHEFLVIQAGDLVTNPLFWDGTTLRRSNGLTGNVTGANINELPPAGPMLFYGERMWYAQNDIVTAGDIARNQSSGTQATYNFRDSILRVTENPLALGGDGFAVDGIVRALNFPANIDETLGQGPLLIGTSKKIHSMAIPVTRTAWVAATDNQPKMVPALLGNGPLSPRSWVHANSDLFHLTREPGVRSLAFARRDYGKWPNVPISKDVGPVVRTSDRSLLKYCAAINFDNRLWQCCQPVTVSGVGIVSRAIAILDFDPLSSLRDQQAPCWQGHYEGLQVLDVCEADFGGLQRAFAIVLSETTNAIDVWDLTLSDTREFGDNRVSWEAVTPAWTWADTIGERKLKQLNGGELWFDQIRGQVDVTVQYRPDFDPCWKDWHAFKMCSARNYGQVYPDNPYGPGEGIPKVLPIPPSPCEAATMRPANLGYQFQVRLQVKGWCRIRSVHLFAEPKEANGYYGITC